MHNKKPQETVVYLVDQGVPEYYIIIVILEHFIIVVHAHGLMSPLGSGPRYMISVTLFCTLC